jgi:hypothetical protein
MQHIYYGNIKKSIFLEGYRNDNSKSRINTWSNSCFAG